MQNAKCKMISGIFACTYDTEKACHPEEHATKDLRITFGFAVNSVRRSFDFALLRSG